MNEGLSAIAEMVAVELGSAPAEVEFWKELVRAVDAQRLEQTGEIVVRDVALNVTTRPARATANRASHSHLHYDPSQVRAAMDRLRHRTSMASSTRAPRAQRHVPQMEEPNYDSADTELWLYGPLS